MRLHRLLVGVLAVGLGASLAARQQTNALSRSLLAAVDRPVLVFALTAVDAGVPVGLELHQSDDVMPQRPPGVLAADSGTVTLAEVASAFNRAQKDYAADIRDGALVIRPIEGRTVLLTQTSTVPGGAPIAGASAAIRQVFSQLDPSLLKPHVGSIGGKGAFADLSAKVTLDTARDRTVMQSLNQIALQAGVGWYAVTRPDAGSWHIVRFGALHRYYGRTITTLANGAAPAAP